MPDEKLSPPPKPRKSDLLYRVEKAAVALTPATQAAAELLGLLESPLERRRARWFGSLWEAVRKLQEHVGELTDGRLAGDDSFVSAVLQATQIAGRTHQQEKLQALRNAVLNVAAGLAPGDDIQSMFLDAVDSLTASHVRFLSALGKARVAPEVQSLVDSVVQRSRKEGRLAAVDGTLSFAREWMPVSTTRGDLLLFVDSFSEPPDLLHPMWPPVLTDILGWQLLQILKDVAGRGFVSVHPPADQFTQVTSTRAFAGVTGQGREFLAFIRSPLADDGGGEAPAAHAPADIPPS